MKCKIQIMLSRFRLRVLPLTSYLLPIASLIIAGCAMPLTVKYDAKFGAPAISLKEQFTLAGFKTQEAVSQDADFLIEGSVKAFSLDIGAKDSIEIEISTTLKDAKTGDIF